ncbi:MAG: cupin domain-containing protein [Firmicutes bacterium]|nr:cupin domain-containing protein [Bacillota bacterium]
MNVIMLSGGSGKRLWPLSNRVRSKQFLEIFRNEYGQPESMVKRMYRMLLSADPSARVTVAAPENQLPQIRAQLGSLVRICSEPARRDTFPAIALAACLLKKEGAKEDEPVVVCPSDPWAGPAYFECIKKMADRCEDANLTLMGIEPTFPSENYGYIIPASEGEVSPILEFKEKPDRALAQSYIEKGALWNGGVFAFKLSYLLGICERLLGTSDHDTLRRNYEDAPKISFDYAVVEKEESLQVIRCAGPWKDLGTWDSLAGVLGDEVIGSAVAKDCEGSLVINELGLPMVVLGIKDSVVAATPDGILVSARKASGLKDLVPDARPMYERRLWGEYRVVYTSPDSNSLVKELVIEAGKQLSDQLHRRRDETWVVTEGEGEAEIGGVTFRLEPGVSVSIKAGVRHMAKAFSDLHIIEVQLGEELSEEDIERF